MVRAGFLRTPADGKISYRHYKNGYDKVIVVIHGFYNSKDSSLLESLCNNLSETSDIFIFDLRGHGKSSGLFTWSAREGDDLAEVFDYLKGHYKKPRLLPSLWGGQYCYKYFGKGEDFLRFPYQRKCTMRLFKNILQAMEA